MLLQDIGPWDEHPTITNDAENVVALLVRDEILQPSQRLFYYDSENELTEILMQDGKFAGFRHPADIEEGGVPTL